MSELTNEQLDYLEKNFPENLEYSDVWDWFPALLAVARERDQLRSERNEDAVSAIAWHLREDDSAYAEGDEADRQARRIIKAIQNRGLKIVKAYGDEAEPGAVDFTPPKENDDATT